MDQNYANANAFFYVAKFLRGIQGCHMKADVLPFLKMWWFFMLYFFKRDLLLPKVRSNLKIFFAKWFPTGSQRRNESRSSTEKLLGIITFPLNSDFNSSSGTLWDPLEESQRVPEFTPSSCVSLGNIETYTGKYRPLYLCIRLT